MEKSLDEKFFSYFIKKSMELVKNNKHPFLQNYIPQKCKNISSNKEIRGVNYLLVQYQNIQNNNSETLFINNHEKNSLNLNLKENSYGIVIKDNNYELIIPLNKIKNSKELFDSQKFLNYEQKDFDKSKSFCFEFFNALEKKELYTPKEGLKKELLNILKNNPDFFLECISKYN